MQDVCKLKDGIKLDSTPLVNLDVKYLRGTSAGKVIDSGKFVTANSYMILVDGENSGEVFKTPIDGYWKSHTNLTHPGKYFRPSKVKIMRPTSPK